MWSWDTSWAHCDTVRSACVPAPHNKLIYLCHLLVLSAPTLMVHGHMNLKLMVHALLFPLLNALHWYISTLRSLCAVSSMACFCSALIFVFFRHISLIFSEWIWYGPSWPSHYWYHFCFFLTCPIFISYVCHILSSSQLLSWSHFCVLKLPLQLTHVFLFHCRWLWCPVYCYVWLCQFSLLD